MFPALLCNYFPIKLSNSAAQQRVLVKTEENGKIASLLSPTTCTRLPRTFSRRWAAALLCYILFSSNTPGKVVFGYLHRHLKLCSARALHWLALRFAASENPRKEGWRELTIEINSSSTSKNKNNRTKKNMASNSHANTGRTFLITGESAQRVQSPFHLALLMIGSF